MTGRSPMNTRALKLIDLLNLQPHPEGGYYSEVYRSSLRVLPTNQSNDRSAVTTIYFLLAAGQHSCWHKVSSDEVWHFYEGAPMELFWTEGDTNVCTRRLLGEVGTGLRPVAVVPAEAWQAARPTGDYTLVGCTVGPGFEFADFQLLRDQPAEAQQIRQRFPELADLV